MPFLVLENIVKKFDGQTVLNNINIEVDKGSFLSILGPSGCGKTTTLRVIAGLESLDEGDIFVSGDKINKLPTYKRNIGIVFQDYALFPHMSVWDNIAYGLKQRRMTREIIKMEIKKVIELVHLLGFENRKPAQLSGGQKQRVALARALVIKPDLLLLDESLSALDKKLRVEMQVELREIQKRTGITTVFITHDQEEALTLSDKIAVMKDGEIVQIDSPKEVYEKPCNNFVANFLGQSNCFSGDIILKNDNIYKLKLENSEIITFNLNENLMKSGHCTITVRPEKMKIHSNKPHVNAIEGKIRFITYAGDTTTYRVEALGMDIKVQQQNASSSDSTFEVGEKVFVDWNSNDSVVLQ